MPDVLVRGVDEKILEKLKNKAARNNRSLQREVQIILQEAINFEPLSDAEVARKIKDALRGRQHSDSAELLREDRSR